MRSFGSRAIRTLIARGFGLAVDAMLVPCIGHAPHRMFWRWCNLRQPIPWSPITPEVGLEARKRLETQRDHQAAPSSRCRMRVEVCKCKPRMAEMVRHVAEARHCPSL